MIKPTNQNRRNLLFRTDFYYVPEGPYENMGFPPGVAEELVIKVLRSCDPKAWKAPNGARKPNDVNNEIMCSTVAQEVEVITEDDNLEEPGKLIKIQRLLSFLFLCCL